MPNKIKKRYLLDWSVLLPYLILSVIGLMMVYSTTSVVGISEKSSTGDMALKQLAFWILGLIAMGIIYKMKNSLLQKQLFSIMAMFVITILLVAAFFFETVNEAYGWIPIPKVGTIQPAEFLKVIVMWYLVSSLAKRQDTMQKEFRQTVFAPLTIIMIQIFILIKYPDYGNAAVILLTVLAIVLSSGVNFRLSYIMGGIILIGSQVVIFILNTANNIPFLPKHVVDRFTIFRNPFADEYGVGHQLIHGYYAIFNGGLFGRGLGNSVQKKGFLKFAHTDYAFAIVVEELGLIAAILILGILFYMIARIILIGIRSNDPFNSMMSIGIGVLFLVSVFVNLGGITGIIPLTGITFPFISQGGSSLLAFSICIGFVLNISADERKKEYGLMD